jgi:hypothetical protein
MSINIKEILKNIEDIMVTDSALVSLMDFERVLDEIDLYAFRNWRKGELVEGPVYEKYHVRCTFMWPRRLMPDPRGGERLLEHDIEVKYQKSQLVQSKKIEDPDDFRPGTKFAKLESKPIWLVEIIMPKQLMQDIQVGSLELETRKIDLDDVDEAYEEGQDQEAEQLPPTGATSATGL